MTKQQLVEVILRKDLKEIEEIKKELDLYLYSKEPKYRTIPIITGDGNIAYTIQKETGFDCFHKYPVQEMTACRGTNYIKIPVEKYTEELENKLKNKYESC